MHKFLKRALKKANQYEYDDAMDYRLAAIIVKGGKMLSVGYNQRATTAFMETLTDVVKGTDRNFNISTHAECASIASVRNKIDLRGCKMYVARIKRDGTPGLSRPCEICRLACANYGLTKIYYTIGPNEYGILKLQVENPDKKFKDYSCHDRLIQTGSLD